MRIGLSTTVRKILWPDTHQNKLDRTFWEFFLKGKPQLKSNSSQIQGYRYRNFRCPCANNANISLQEQLQTSQI